MDGELAVTSKDRAAQMRSQVNMIQGVMGSVMKKDVHYGVIPGCKKPSLYKPGAEKILMTFRLVADNPIIEDLSTGDSIHYRVTQRLLDLHGNLIGSASGECSSDEDKYKWRRPVCDQEYEETAEDRRMEKWVMSYGKPSKIKRIRTNPSDVGNTILKMAVKRALVAVTLTSTAASDVFDQDIEDLPEELLHGENKVPVGKPDVSMPEEKKPQPTAKPETTQPATNGNGRVITDKQQKRLFALSKGKVDQDELKIYLKEKYNIESSALIKMDDYEAICKWVGNGGYAGEGIEGREPGEDD